MPPELIFAMSVRNPNSRLSKEMRELVQYLESERGFDPVGLRSICAFCRSEEHEPLPKNVKRFTRARFRNDRGRSFPLLFFLILMGALFISFFFLALI